MADKYRYAFVVSFPGGLVDPDDEDDIIMTATRETEEEIGIPRHKIKVLGKFHDVTTTANRDLAISSVLGFIGDAKTVEDFNLIPNLTEIEIVFTVPVGDLLERNPARLGRTNQSFGPRINIVSFPSLSSLSLTAFNGLRALAEIILLSLYMDIYVCGQNSHVGSVFPCVTTSHASFALGDLFVLFVFCCGKREERVGR